MADWSRAEVEAIVADYLSMLEAERRGEVYNKTEHRRELFSQLNKRSKGSVERKHMNISAVLLELGVAPIDGYKPLGNYQQLLAEVVDGEVAMRPNLLAVLEADVRREASIPTVDAILGIKVAPPKPIAGLKTAYPRRTGDAPRLRIGVDFPAREAANTKQGADGEELVLRYEQARLLSLGLDHLAKRVERVSKTRGDGLGYDILSFERSSKERLIEVKTTKYGWYYPFLTSRNEVRVSGLREAEYHLYRVFNFERNPQFFSKRGNLEHEFRLSPHTYEARIA